jgi:hypothetical protein
MIDLNWITSPVAIYATIGTSLAGCLAVILAFNAELSKVIRDAERSGEATARQVKEMEEDLEQVRLALGKAASRPSPAAGMNLTRRAQALRMHRRGESVETITATLGTPRNEVELLLKLSGVLAAKNN